MGISVGMAVDVLGKLFEGILRGGGGVEDRKRVSGGRMAVGLFSQLLQSVT